MAPQWGVLPSNDQTPSTIKSGTHHNPITLQPREYSSANEKTSRGCVLDVWNGKNDIYRHKKPIIEVLEDSGGRRGGQWAVLCLKSFMTSAAVLLTWLTYDLLSPIVSQVFYDISSPVDLTDIWPVACWVLLWLKSPLLTSDHFSCVTSHMDWCIVY